MKTFGKMFIILLVSFLISFSVCWAHHFWVEKLNFNEFEIKWGHPYKRIDPYEPQMIEKIIAFNIRGKKANIKKIDFKNKVLFKTKDKISLVAIISKPKYYVVSLTSEGKKKYYKITKQEALQKKLPILDSFYSQQFAKSVFDNSPIITQPLGLTFEIIPLKNPLELTAGAILPIKILFKGKPIKGLTVETKGHKKIGETDDNGLAKISIPEGNLKVICVRYRIPLKNNPKADYKVFTTVLTWK